MDRKQDLREQTNPVFNTAKSMLLHLRIAGDKDAALLAEKFGIDADSLLGAEGDRQEVALSPEMTVMSETRFRSINKISGNYKNSTVVDIGCGYTPRALKEPFKDMRYIGCDLPIVTDELAPVIGGICAERGIKNTEYHGTDATNYRSLRDALNTVDGEITVLSDGLLTYLSNSELTELCLNIRRLLKEFGGRWITSDTDANPLFMAALTVVHGKAAYENLLKTMYEYAEQSDTNIEVQNMTVLAYDFENTMKTVTNFLRSVGLKWERVPISDYVTEIGSLADYSDEAKADYIKSLENVYIWIFTPDENYRETEENYESDIFGVTAKAHGGKMEITLRGRLDSITAPELLGVYEKTTAREKVEKIIVDASELEYISSAGLRVLLMMIKQVGDGNLAVTGQNDTVQTIFDQTGFTKLTAQKN